ncbi:hypothetical protein [Pseudomonas nicosulfuronedens]
MPIKKDLSGLKRLIENAKSLEGRNQVPFLDVMNPLFISSVSRFGSFAEFAQGAGYVVLTSEDLEAIPDAPWDQFIRQETHFQDWAEMQKTALTEYTKNRLLSGISR